MKRIIKNQPANLTFGDETNSGTLIPIAIKPDKFFASRNETVIIMAYPEDDRTINLVFENEEIDFDSFEEH